MVVTGTDVYIISGSLVPMPSHHSVTVGWWPGSKTSVKVVPIYTLHCDGPFPHAVGLQCCISACALVISTVHGCES